MHGYNAQNPDVTVNAQIQCFSIAQYLTMKLVSTRDVDCVF